MRTPINPILFPKLVLSKGMRLAAFLLLFVFNSSFADNPHHKIDSLLSLIQKDKPDTNMVRHLTAIGECYYNMGNVKASLETADSIEALSIRLNYQKGLANAYTDKGTAFMQMGENDKALDYEHKALKIFTDLGDKKDVGMVMSTIGNIYGMIGDYSKSMEYFSDALQTSIEIGNKQGEAINNNNIGIIYAQQSDFPKALDYFLRGLKIDRELGDMVNIAKVTGNLGVIYEDMGDYKKACDNFLEAIKQEETLGNKRGVALNQGNLANAYNNMNKTREALSCLQDALKIGKELDDKYLQVTDLTTIGNTYRFMKGGTDTTCMSYYFAALKIAIEIESKQRIVEILGSIGEAYNSQKQYKKAIPYLRQSLDSGLVLGIMKTNMKIYNDLSNSYRGLNDWHNAYAMSVKCRELEDTINNQDNNREVGRLEAKGEFDKQIELQKANDNKNAALASAESTRQRLLILLIGAIALAVVILAITIFRSLKTTRKQKGQIEMQKMVVEQQKLLVEEKNKEIVDSINYAKRLQDAILPPITEITKQLPESFVLYKPKDIVAGDFYWFEKLNDTIFIAAADSTGHGVPGAMVSVVCSNALNRAVKEFGITDTGKILDKVRELVIETFSHRDHLGEKNETNVMDGMDISLAAIGYQPLANSPIKLQWSGANIPLWYNVGGALVEVSPDKQPIGKHDGQKPFTMQEIPLVKGNTFYLFTDGFADQFGGPKGKKFKYKQFQDILISLSKADMQQQKQELNTAFENWKGKLEQVDDVLVIGIRV